MDIYDIGIVGVGVAGATALLKILQNNKNAKVAIFDAGRPSQKRRHQVYGFLGTMPGSDGKLYTHNLEKINDNCGHKKTKNYFNWVVEQFSQFTNLLLTKDNDIEKNISKNLTNNGYSFYKNDYYQLIPKEIHGYSKYITNIMETSPHLDLHFDDTITKIVNNKDYFTIYSDTDNEVNCKKIIFCVGRGGWRWAGEVFNEFGIIEDNNSLNFGIRIETAATNLKGFNNSNLTIKKNNIEIGPLSWEGTVIPEDHLDMAITSYRSNENRWKTDKVSFNFIGSHYCENNAFQQANRIGQLTYILGNDRMMKERITLLFERKSKLTQIKEYDWLLDKLKDLEKIIPDVIEKGSFYAPTIMPWAPKINLGNDFSTEINNFYVAGETAGVPGILGALVSGAIVGDTVS